MENEGALHSPQRDNADTNLGTAHRDNQPSQPDFDLFRTYLYMLLDLTINFLGFGIAYFAALNLAFVGERKFGVLTWYYCGYSFDPWCSLIEIGKGFSDIFDACFWLWIATFVVGWGKTVYRIVGRFLAWLSQFVMALFGKCSWPGGQQQEFEGSIETCLYW